MQNMSVGEDQSTANFHRPRAGARLGRVHTFLLGLLVGAGVLYVGGRWIPSGEVDLDQPPQMQKAAMVGVSARGIPPAKATTDEPQPQDDPPLALTEPVRPPHHAIALVTRAAPANLKYELPPPDLVRREGTLKPNEFIATIFTDAGATLAEQDELFRSLRGKFDFRLARPGQHYRLAVDHEGQVVSFEYRAAVDEVYRVQRTKAGELKAEKVDIPLTREVVQVDGKIVKSLWDAFVDAGESPALAMDLAEAFQFDIDFFHDTRKGRPVSAIRRKVLERSGRARSLRSRLRRRIRRRPSKPGRHQAAVLVQG